MTDSYISELQKPDPSAIIQLYELELVEGLHYATGNPDNVITTYRWHSGMTAAGAASITFNSQIYTPMPVEAEGFDQKSGQNDSLARPVLRVSNLLSTVSTILTEVNKITAGNDLLNAKVTRIETLAMFLDSVNFINQTTTFVVTVVQDSYGSNVFAIDGAVRPTLTLSKGDIYVFDQSHSSNVNHPIAFRETDDTSYTTGVITEGNAGSAGAKTTFEVTSTAPSALKYYCTFHGNGMGNNITVNNLYVNPTANPNAISRKQIFVVDRKSIENKQIVEFELSGVIDQPNVKLPKRQVLPRQFPGVGSFHE